MIATDYARALYAAAQDNSEKGTQLIKNLRALLARRGHSRLLPHILTEYEKLSLRDRRRERYARVTPEAERTRVLLDLYRTLIKTH